MEYQQIIKAIKAADEAITSEDFDALMEFYADDAVLVIKPGLIAKGKENIRKAFVAIADYFGHNLVVKQGEIQVIQGANTALVIMETILETVDSKGGGRRERLVALPTYSAKSWTVNGFALSTILMERTC
ncbi:YybH family protein [Methylobacter luteus]|uniref:YybH family protein n=1 Tax=Methylobacter luteus TaxID=415 RepID=UPI000418C5A0|nr:nuclear transport factor 2 family protein [Methylobacter luteus]